MTSTAVRAARAVVRRLRYDEAGQLISLSHGTTTKFEFGYGYDGARRWSKDTTTNVWSWLPCGVQCSAGELVEMQSTNNGGTWSTVSTNLAATSCGGGLIRAGSSFLYTDFFGQVAQTRDASRNVQATAVFDAFGVQRFGTGTLASGVLRNTYGDNNEDGMSAFLMSRFGYQLVNKYRNCAMEREVCMKRADAFLAVCIGGVTTACAALFAACKSVCIVGGAWTAGKACIACFGLFGLGCLAAYAGCYFACSAMLGGCQAAYLRCRLEKDRRR